MLGIMALEDGQRDQSRMSITAMELIGKKEEEPKMGILARMCWAVCQCVMDNDYQETLSFDESFEDQPFLSPQPSCFVGRITLVLDLDETLIHSSLSPLPKYDFSFPLDSDNSEVFIAIRPGVPTFLSRMSELFEVIIFTASMQGYADPLIDHIDPCGWVSARLFRQHCRLLPFGYLKDLGRLGRNLNKVIIVDVSVR